MLSVNRVLSFVCCLLCVQTVVSTGILRLLIGRFLNCLSPGTDSFLYTQSSVSEDKGPFSLRFFNGVNSSVEVALKDGASIMDLSGFDVGKTTLFYLHGYKENIDSESIHVIANAFLEHGDTNVIVVDWSSYASLDYPRAVSHCVNDVPQLADVIKQMVERGIPLEKFHVMGHSLGAQCAGYVAKQFTEPKLKQVTGLDPAGPLFGVDCSLGLTSGDAEFVHTIHTDRGIYGSKEVCGDFSVIFNNDGSRLQPGCECVIVPMTFTFKEVCSHHRSWRFYADSIAHPEDYKCIVCDSYEDFTSGKCNSSTPLTAAYGVDRSSRGKCYLETTAKKPFGKGIDGLTPTTEGQ